MRVGEQSRYCFANRTEEQSCGLLLAVLEAGQKRGCEKKQRLFFFFSMAALQFADSTLVSIDQSEK